MVLCRSNGRSCTVNTVLWNTIQLLFPQEVEARKAAGALNSREAELQSQVKEFNNLSNRRAQASVSSSRDISARRRRAISSQGEDAELHNNVRRGRRLSRVSSRDVGASSRGILNQDEDAALALRLQREEFMEAFRGTDEQSSRSLSSARANLRAMASRAINLRDRGRHM